MPPTPMRRPANVGELLPAEKRPVPGHQVQAVTEWSESCACGDNFLGHEEVISVQKLKELARAGRPTD